MDNELALIKKSTRGNGGWFQKMTPERRREIARMGGLVKGKKPESVKMREAVMEQIQNTIAERAMKLVDLQSILAFGGLQVFRVDYYYEGKVKKARRPVLVIDPEELADCIHYEYGDGDAPEINSDMKYYFVITREPDNNAINSLLDRGLGKAMAEMKITGMEKVDEEAKRLTKLAWENYVKPAKNKKN
jgi:hypothetical protein